MHISQHGPSYLTPLCSDKLEKAASQERLVVKAGFKVEATVPQVALISVKVRNKNGFHFCTRPGFLQTGHTWGRGAECMWVAGERHASGRGCESCGWLAG